MHYQIKQNRIKSNKRTGTKEGKRGRPNLFGQHKEKSTTKKITRKKVMISVICLATHCEECAGPICWSKARPVVEKVNK